MFFRIPLGNIDKAGPGKFFVMVYSQIDDSQFQPIIIPIHVHPLPSNHIRISISPPKIGTYRIYTAYRNIPINGKRSAACLLVSIICVFSTSLAAR